MSLYSHGFIRLRRENEKYSIRDMCSILILTKGHSSNLQHRHVMFAGLPGHVSGMSNSLPALFRSIPSTLNGELHLPLVFLM